MFYDKFEQRVFVEQGNNVKTAYNYDARTRRLASLTAQKNDGTLFQNLAYSYDKVGNILALANNVAVPPPNVYGGPTSQSFAYDELYRLTHAQGTFQFSPTKTHTYSMDMGYDTIHNIVSKNQLHTIIQPSTQAVTQKKTTYNFAYTYNPSGVNSIRPHAPNHIDVRSYSYDLDGNQTGWTHDTNGTRRNITWDDENRIQAVFDNGQEKDYKYDDQGQRMIKRGPQGETVYVNQFFTDRPGATGTKHVYAGTTRIASKLMRQDVPNSNPNGNTPFEKDLFFYHPDHIGSSNYVTDLNGKLYEHLEYFPFGEAWVEENSNTQRTPYLFSAKELDEETGLYYFGARYYDPRTSVWQSADPILGKYLPDAARLPRPIWHGQPEWRMEIDLPGMGGVFKSINLGLFTYAQNNPVRWVDPDGLDTNPARSFTITSGYGERENPVSGKREFHDAIDLPNPVGGSVVAVREGKIIKTTQGEGGANAVTIMYKKGKDEEQTYGVYSHVTSNLKAGDKVKEGGAIGVTDLSGQSTGGHVHYQKRNEEGHVDPTPDVKDWNPHPDAPKPEATSITPRESCGCDV